MLPAHSLESFQGAAGFSGVSVKPDSRHGHFRRLVGRVVRFDLASHDVIHSFWIPTLQGKRDLVPGEASSTTLRPDHAGTYYGQCAEYCGYQHAKMVIFVIADAPADYDRWADGQRKPATTPANDEERRGQELFVGSTCAMCHTVGGTRAQGRRAPDLTHIASRLTIAAGIMPNNAGTRAAWIADPHQFKPGVNMPAHSFAPQDMAAINAYLESLQ